jgi:hypothetical protein
MNRDFKFFVPVEISKGKNAQGEEVMRLSGVASTMDKDSDDEVLDPNGFDLDHFLKSGFVNWHHQKDPASIIGEPTKAFIKDNQMHLEVELYPWSSLAKNVYELAEGLKKSKGSRKLGWSIEGKATERDLINPKYVKKAKILGMAITPMPKNAQTFLDVVKGHYVECEDEIETEEAEEIPNANGGQVHILDYLKPNGDRITIDKDFNITVKKALTTDAGSGKALIPEHVEGGPVKGMKVDIKDKKVQNALIVLQKAYEMGKLEKSKYEELKGKLC